jgi:hypothetical protein
MVHLVLVATARGDLDRDVELKGLHMANLRPVVAFDCTPTGR